MADPEIIALVAGNITDQAVHTAAEQRKTMLLAVLQGVLDFNPNSILGVAVNRFFPEHEAKQGDWLFEIDQPAVCTCGEMYPVSTVLKKSLPHDNLPGKAVITRPLIAWCPVCDNILDLLSADGRKIT